MDSKRNNSDLVFRGILALVAVAITATALYFGSGLHPLWWLAWVAPFPVLLVAPRLSGWAAGLTALAAWALGSLNMWHYHHVTVEIPLLPALAILLSSSAVFAVAVLVFRVLARRGAVVEAALSFPALWVACEYLNSVISPHSTFGNFAYSQMNFLPVLQVASITGIWGISFCVLLFPAVAAALFLSQSAPRRRIELAAIAAVFFCSGARVWSLAAPCCAGLTERYGWTDSLRPARESRSEGRGGRPGLSAICGADRRAGGAGRQADPHSREDGHRFGEVSGIPG